MRQPHICGPGGTYLNRAVLLGHAAAALASARSISPFREQTLPLSRSHIGSSIQAVSKSGSVWRSPN
jgi:hypothetical protein